MPLVEDRVINHPGSWAERKYYAWLLDNHSPHRFGGIGGARGGAKSEMEARGASLVSLQYPGTVTLILRKGTQAVVDNYRKIIDAYADKIGVKVGLSYFKNDHRFEWHNGSEIHLGFIEREEHYDRYIGQEYGLIILSQAEQHPKQRWVDLVSGGRRSQSIFIPKAGVDFNPGGIGQTWLTELFVSGEHPDHLWIPCRVMDNPAVIIKNPDYIRKNLASQPDFRKKQWILGDMNAQAGQYFDVTPKNVVPTEEIFARHCHGAKTPYWGKWTAGVDYGDSSPFAVTYNVRWKDMSNNEHRHTFSEIYESNLDMDEQAARVREHETMLRDQGIINDRVTYFADPQVFARMSVISTATNRLIAQAWQMCGFHVNRARTRSRVPGWKLMKQLLREKMGQVVWTIDPQCMALLNEMRTVVPNGWPGIVKDEDIEQGPEIPDHAIDCNRYDAVSTFGVGYKHVPCDPLTGKAYHREQGLAIA